MTWVDVGLLMAVCLMLSVPGEFWGVISGVMLIVECLSTTKRNGSDDDD